MSHPYELLPQRCFWNSAVAGRHMFEIEDWHQPRFDIKNMQISTAGSCFAQHIRRHLIGNHLPFLDLEPAPPFLPKSLHSLYGYGLFSARYGNIYTPRALLQLIQRALGKFEPKEKYWPKGSGWVDAFRPNIEPKPFVSVDEVLEQQQFHLQKVKELFSRSELFIFTLGLTEAWCSKEDGAVYPLVPGSRQGGGNFDEQKYTFHNFNYEDIVSDLKMFYMELIRLNPRCKILLTVSPVPLVATATQKHVVSATTYSKSVLRAAAGYLADNFDNIDYFPSYEIISSHVMQGSAYLANKRNISSFGVKMVMRHFFKSYGFDELREFSGQPAQTALLQESSEEVCDEEILNAFLELKGNNHDAK